MRLMELLEGLTHPIDGINNNPMIVLKAKWYNKYGESLHFVYKGAVVCAKELLALPQAILDKPLLSVKVGEGEFGLSGNNTIVSIDYILEIPF